MAKFTSLTVFAYMLITLVAVGISSAYPPATLDADINSITVGNLECDTNYRLRVEERRNGVWRDRQTYTQRTDSCPPPPPVDSDNDGIPDSDDTCPNEAGPPPSGCPEPPPTGGFPNRSTTGVPDGWIPQQTRSTNLTVTQPGAIVQDVRFTDGADLFINAPNVTVRRVELQGGWINNWPEATCNNGLVIEDTSIIPRAGQDYGNDSEGVVSYGGYTARRVEIWHRSEGFRVGGQSGGCGPVRIEDSFAQITPPQPCGDWHGDGIQGYDGATLTVRNTTLELVETGCGGTAPFFYPSGQGNTSVDINGLLVKGGGYSFRLGTPGTVTGLKISNNDWYYGPIDVNCSVLSSWEAKIANIDTNFQVTSIVRDQPCNTSSG